MATKRNEFTTSEFYCTVCGKKGIPIVRRPGRQKEPGHLKKIFCIQCGEETNHAEIRPFGSYNKEDFEKEFELGRFVDGNKIPIKELISCTKIDCKYNESGKCWNANYNYDCPHRINRKEVNKDDIK